MKGYLLDTNVALIATGASAKLPAKLRHAIDRGPAYLSVVSYWEVVVKTMKGSLNVGDVRPWFEETADALSLRQLPYRPAHVAEILSLPPVHRDPFDRALIAQAMAEDLTLLTTDATIPKYASDRFRVIR